MPSQIARTAGLSLRQAARTASIAYLLNPVVYAEVTWPRLVVAGNAAQTVQNISAHGGTFVAVLFSYLISFTGDVVIAWALYVLLAPVNRALSLLAAWFQMVYAAIALSGVMQLTVAYNLVTTPHLRSAFTDAALQAQVTTLLSTFRSTFSVSLLLFGIHLVLLGALVCRSTYIPKYLGVLLMLNGLAWVIDSSSTYLFPRVPLGFVHVFFFGELAFLLWLLLRGWRLEEAEVAPVGA